MSERDKSVSVQRRREADTSIGRKSLSTPDRCPVETKKVPAGPIGEPKQGKKGSIVAWLISK